MCRRVGTRTRSGERTEDSTGRFPQRHPERYQTGTKNTKSVYQIRVRWTQICILYAYVYLLQAFGTSLGAIEAYKDRGIIEWGPPVHSILAEGDLAIKQLRNLSVEKKGGLVSVLLEGKPSNRSLPHSRLGLWLFRFRNVGLLRWTLKFWCEEATGSCPGSWLELSSRNVTVSFSRMCLQFERVYHRFRVTEYWEDCPRCGDRSKNFFSIHQSVFEERHVRSVRTRNVFKNLRGICIM